MCPDLMHVDHRRRSLHDRIAPVVCALVLLAASRASGENFGAATSDSWFDPATWVDSSGNSGVPGASDNAFIGASGFPDAGAISNATVTLSANATVSNVTIGTYQTTTGNGTLVLAGGVLSGAGLTLDGSAGGAATLTLNGGSLDVSGELALIGASASVTRTSGSLTASDLSLANGASLTTSAADTITAGATLSSDSALILGASLSLSGALSVTDATLNLEGFSVTASGGITLADGGVVNRGAGDAGTVSADGFTISGVTAFTAQSGDAFTGDGSVSGGGSFTADTPLAGLSSLAVTGTGSAFAANSQLSGGAHFAVTVTNGAALTINNGLTSGTLSASAATFELNGGTLDVATLLLGDGNGAATVIRGGGTIDAGNVTIDGGTSLTSLAGDAFDSLLMTTGEVTVRQASGDSTGLWIRNATDSALTIDAIGGLTLVFDSAAAASSLDWILKWGGNRLTALNALLDDGFITVNAANYQVSYDEAQNATFIAVPEPSSSALSMIGVVASLAAWRKRRRRSVRHVATSPHSGPNLV